MCEIETHFQSLSFPLHGIHGANLWERVQVCMLRELYSLMQNLSGTVLGVGDPARNKIRQNLQLLPSSSRRRIRCPFLGQAALLHHVSGATPTPPPRAPAGPCQHLSSLPSEELSDLPAPVSPTPTAITTLILSKETVSASLHGSPLPPAQGRPPAFLGRCPSSWALLPYRRGPWLLVPPSSSLQL